MIRILIVLSIGLLPVAGSAYNDRINYPYAGRYYGYGRAIGPDPQIELSRIRRELRMQRRLGAELRRSQETELALLRQQSMSAHQISADQACYYRSTGGFELCADLFERESEDFSACETLVVQRNPSCNREPLEVAP